MRKFITKVLLILAVMMFVFSGCGGGGNDVTPVPTPTPIPSPISDSDDIIFIHHSCGENWLNNSLEAALVVKSYLDECNEIYYGTDITPDSERPDSLAETPGNNTNMNHWIYWFNDYLGKVKTHDCTTGVNRIIMFKSCFLISDIGSDGTEPGDPFSEDQSIANYKAVYRHYPGTGNTYLNVGYTYKPLEDIFAENPATLFIIVTAPPLRYDISSNENAHRARVFNDWLKNDWLSSYNTANPELNNVAVFDLFNILAYADDHTEYPNRLNQDYDTDDSHPNDAANSYSTGIFASNSSNFLDTVWTNFYNSQL